MLLRKTLKKKSREKLYKIIWDLETKLGTVELELHAEEYVHSINKQALASCESALHKVLEVEAMPTVTIKKWWKF